MENIASSPMMMCLRSVGRNLAAVLNDASAPMERTEAWNTVVMMRTVARVRRIRTTEPLPLNRIRHPTSFTPSSTCSALSTPSKVIVLRSKAEPGVSRRCTRLPTTASTSL
ncbi:hypothetical protein [Brevibacterium sp. Mu109]|uniref:hypothetical protein n=1 Tax=Brevibacterium sp. Mu109 TaxID=1255669 RepID=UPI000C77B0F3|nr:hypothetical protein [Brevibacterium sp. Mu109]